MQSPRQCDRDFQITLKVTQTYTSYYKKMITLSLMVYSYFDKLKKRKT